MDMNDEPGAVYTPEQARELADQIESDKPQETVIDGMDIVLIGHGDTPRMIASLRHYAVMMDKLAAVKGSLQGLAAAFGHGLVTDQNAAQTEQLVGQLLMSPAMVPVIQGWSATVEDLKRQLAEARFSPMGDNHHNALVCPYCSGNRLNRVPIAAMIIVNAVLEHARLDVPTRQAINDLCDNDVRIVLREFLTTPAAEFRSKI